MLKSRISDDGARRMDTKPNNNEASGKNVVDEDIELAENLWRYDEITATLEAEIHRLMQESTAMPIDAGRYQAWAYGIGLGLYSHMDIISGRTTKD